MVQSKDYEIIPTGIQGLHYYKKEMKTKIEKSYYAHVFFVEPMTEKQLEVKWEELTAVVAVRFQSLVQALIERSNFYIFFYIKDDIDDSLREKIEGDEFCARKYVIKETYINEEQAIGNINAKLFLFSTTEMISGSKNPVHVNQLVLHNFRIYENERTFDFTCSDNGPSSFVLLYAKNGVGKTSIFDGVEFLLKGVVERIDVLQKKNSKSGTPKTMLHNINHEKEDAFVAAFLSDSTELERRVGKKSDNDLRRSTPTKGRDFIYNGKNPKDWQQIILPHDSIDGYTTITAPDKVYSDWISQSNLGKKSEQFKKIVQECKKVKNEVSDYGGKINSLENKLKELSRNRDAVKEIIDLILLFNNKKRELGFPEGDDLSLSLEAEINAYDSLINSAKAYYHIIDSCLREQILSEKEKLCVIQSRGEEYYAKKHEDFIFIKNQQIDLQKKFTSRKKLEEIMETKSAVSNNITADNNELQQVLIIKSCGGPGTIWEKADRILQLQMTEANYKEKISQMAENLDKQRTALIMEKIETKALDDKLKDEDQYKKIRTDAEHYETANAMLNQVKVSRKYSEAELERLERSIYQKENDNKISFINLPDKLQEVSIETVQAVGELIGFTKVEVLLSLVNKYKSTTDKVILWEQQIQESSKNEGELDAIIQQASTYVAKHPESCKCPVCGTIFESNTKLYRAITDNYTLQHENLLEKLKEGQEQLSILEEQYFENVSTLRNEVLKVVKSSADSLAKLKADYKQKKEEVTHLLELQQKGEKRLEELGIKLTQYGEDYQKDPVNTVEQWYAKNRDELKLRNERLEKLNEEVIRIEKELNSIQKSQEQIINELQALNSDSKLLQSIEYMKEKNREWSAEEEEVLIRSRIAEMINRYIHLCKEEEHYSEVKDLKSDFISGQLKTCEERLDSLQLNEEVYAKYFGNDNLRLTEELSQLEKKEYSLKDEQEIIQKIIDENGARNYFEEYRKTIEEKNQLTEQRSDLIKEADQYEKLVNKKKVELEEKLKEHFNQAVMNTVFSKIDPHRKMKRVKYTIEFSEDDVTPQLYLTASDGNRNIRPEWYFSTAQMNTLVFSAFFSRALKSDLDLKTIFIDDPIAHFDDMNILGFADLMRCLIMETPFQFIMSTHDRKIYEIMRRKLPSDLYRAKYIEL